LPAAQAEQAAPSLKKPALHVSREQALLPVDVYAPTVDAGQALHAAAPATGENVPAAQEVHALEPSAEENLPASHVTHCEPFGVYRYVPLAQLVHAVALAAE
jgi:hypothetical protein